MKKKKEKFQTETKQDINKKKEKSFLPSLQFIAEVLRQTFPQKESPVPDGCSNDSWFSKAQQQQQKESIICFNSSLTWPTKETLRSCKPPIRLQLPGSHFEHSKSVLKLLL